MESQKCDGFCVRAIESERSGVVQTDSRLSADDWDNIIPCDRNQTG